jgi:hypothetical protein
MSTVLTGVEGAGYVGTATAPVAGEPVTAASVQVVAQAILDDAAYLNAVVSDGTHTINCNELDAVSVIVAGAGSLLQSSVESTFTGITTIQNISGSLIVSATTTVSGATTHSGVTKFTGRTVERAPLYIAEANITLDQNTGANRIIMSANPTANRVITLRQSTAPIPENGDWFEVMVTLGASAFTVVLQREGSVEFVAVFGDGIGAAGNHVVSARVQLVSGAWRLMSTGGRYAFYGADS